MIKGVERTELMHGLIDLISGIAFLMMDELPAIRMPGLPRNGEWLGPTPERILWFKREEYEKRLEIGMVDITGDAEIDGLVDLLGSFAMRRLSLIPMVRVQDHRNNAHWMGPNLDNVEWFSSGDYNKRVQSQRLTKASEFSMGS